MSDVGGKFSELTPANIAALSKVDWGELQKAFGGESASQIGDLGEYKGSSASDYPSSGKDDKKTDPPATSPPTTSADPTSLYGFDPLSLGTYFTQALAPWMAQQAQQGQALNR